MLYDFEKFDTDWNPDVLLIKNTGRNITLEEINQETPWIFGDYNSKTDEYELSGLLDLTEWDDNLSYNGNSFEIIASPIDKIKYAFASLHNDDIVEAAVKKVFPEINNIKIPAKRYTRKYYLKYWMTKYNFLLQDFISNDKYVVLSCTGMVAREFDALVDNGLINWDIIDKCSEGDVDE